MGQETEAAYMKILESSQTLLHVLKRETVNHQEETRLGLSKRILLKALLHFGCLPSASAVYHHSCTASSLLSRATQHRWRLRYLVASWISAWALCKSFRCKTWCNSEMGGPFTARSLKRERQL